MKNGFIPAEIGSICRLVNGRAFKPSDWSTEGIPIVRIQNLNDTDKPFNYYLGTPDDKHLADDGDVLLSWSGTPGTSFGCFIWNRGKGVVNQHIFKVHVDERKVDKEYFVFAVNSVLDEMIAQAHGGVGLRHITKGKLEALQVPVHRDLQEQRRIVGCINEMMERVDEITTLQEGVKAEAEHLDTVLFGELEHSTAFPRLKIESLIHDSQNGRSISKADREANGAVLTLTAVRDVYLNCSCFKEIQLDSNTAEQFSFCQGDVFVSRSNTRGLVGLAAVATEAAPNGMIYPDLLIKLTVDRSKVIPEYLAFALRFPSVRDQIRSHAKGTSQSMVKISGSSLREIEVPVPGSKDEQERTLAGLRNRHARAKAIQANVAEIPVNHVRHSILRKAFAGEL
jgi:type I restriction enzyme S subunit